MAVEKSENGRRNGRRNGDGKRRGKRWMRNDGVGFVIEVKESDDIEDIGGKNGNNSLKERDEKM